MEKFKNIEVFHIETTDDGMFAYISFQDTEKENEFPNHGYDWMKIPINPRSFQFSAYGNLLVDQSKKECLNIVNTTHLP